MPKLIEKHPLAIRWFHWIHFPVLFVMIWSGLLIYWAYHPYKIQVGNTVLISFFPDWFFKALRVPFRLAQGMAWHFTWMWVFGINGLMYTAYLLISGQWKHLFPQKTSFREAWQVLLHDLGIGKHPDIRSKYNGAQRIAYTLVLLMGAGSLLTGLAIYKPAQLSWLTTALGGYTAARQEHFILTIAFVLFFLIHVIQVLRAGWNNFRAMVAGFEVAEDKPKPEHVH